MPGEIDFLRELIAIPSLSGEETAIAVFIEETTRRWGLDVVRNANSVQIEVRGWGGEPTLALASHLGCERVCSAPGTRSAFSPNKFRL